MMRIAGCLAAGAAVLTFAVFDSAGAASRLPAGVPPAAALLLRYDANHDGVVTREEMEAGLKVDFAAADGNGDGCLNPAEVRAENNRRLAQDGAEASPLRDWNLDGCVDMKEFSNTAHSYFDLADKTKDGKVTLLELRGPSMPIAPPQTISRAEANRQQQQKQQQQQQQQQERQPLSTGGTQSPVGTTTRTPY
jgi:Ca2+-binding EF-hand superfamily protein